MSQEFKLENIVETRNYFFKEINQNELMSKKHEKVCTALNHFEHYLIQLYNYCMYFNLCFCFCDWYFYKNYKFCNRIKNLCNNCRNEKV